MQRFHYDVHLYRVLFGNSRAVNLKNEIMRKILLAALAAVLTVSAHGQNKKITISGYIHDDATGETLIGAGVVAAESSAIGAVTNDFGFYTLTIPAGKTTLSYSYVGCRTETVSIDLTRDTTINMSLKEADILDAATVVARKDAGIRSTYMGALEIPQEMIQNTPVIFGEADIIKTLQMMPGVQPGMEGFSGIYVRGGGVDENLMMLDGSPLYNVSHMLGLFSVFTPEAVKKVTFYKGSFPAKYGGRVSSIVDVRTNDGNAKGFHGSVTAGLLCDKLHFEGPLGREKTTFSISGRGMHTFLFDKIIRACGSPANYAFYDVNAKVAHRFSDRDRLFLSFYHGRDYFRYKDSDKGTATISSGDGSSYKEYSEDDVKANLKWGNMLAVMRWNHVFSNKLFANTSVSWNKYDMNIKSDIREMVKSEKEFYDNTYKYGYNSGIMDFGGRIDFDYTPAPQHLIRFGTEFIRHAYRPSVQRVREINEDGVKKTLTDEKTDISPNVYGSELSLYMEDDMTLGDHFSFNPGARLSLFFVDGKAYFSPEPRVALKYSFGEGWALKTAYSRMSQYVHLLTSGDISLPTDLWVPITKNIRPVTSDIVSLGAYFSGLKGWEFSLEGYWKRLNNVLEYKDGKMAFTSAANWEENVEMGEGRAYGAEFYVQKTTGKTTGTASYTLAWANRRFKDGTINNGNWFPFVYDRRHNVTLSLIQKIGKRVELSAVWTYMSGSRMTVPTRKSFVITPDGDGTNDYDYIESRNNYKLPPTHRLDFNFSFHKQKKRGERIWNFGIYNAYGALNPNFIMYDGSHTKKDPTTGEEIKSPVLIKKTFLIFYPSFSYTFKF